MNWHKLILTRVKTLPPFPGTVARIARIMNDSKAGSKEVEEILSIDPSLTANVLKLANSGLFARGREITSVRQAVSLLGLKRVFELVVVMAFSDKIPAEIPGYGVDASSFWLHSIAVAVMTDMLAVRTGEKGGLYFTAGLLHDVGKLVIGTFLSRYATELLSEIKDGNDMISFEQERFGVDHALVGREICAKWNLPEELQAAAGFHHSPMEAGKHVKLASLVHVADFLAHSWGLGSDVGEMARRVEPKAMELLEINDETLESIGAEALDVIREMEEAMNPGEGMK